MAQARRTGFTEKQGELNMGSAILSKGNEYWWKSTCSCVSCGFTEGLPDSVVFEMIASTRGCPIHGDGAWPPRERCQPWFKTDYLALMDLFLSFEISVHVFMAEFTLQFEEQPPGLEQGVFEDLFALYVDVDRLFGAHLQGDRLGRQQPLRAAIKRTRKALIA